MMFQLLDRLNAFLLSDRFIGAVIVLVLTAIGLMILLSILIPSQPLTPFQVQATAVAECLKSEQFTRAECIELARPKP